MYDEDVYDGLINTNNGKLVDISFIAKHDVEVNRSDFIHKDLFHLCPLNVYAKIMRQGLVPKHKNKEFGYSPRVHFLFDENDINFLLYKESFNKGEKDFVLLKIILDNLVPYKFFYDPRMNGAIYTYETINPAYIHPYRFLTTTE